MRNIESDPNFRLRAFLAESLELWRVAGTVEAGEQPVVAAIHANDGTVISIEPFPVRPERNDVESKDERPQPPPFRWIVRRRSVGDAGEGRPRPCGSLVGVLNAIRGALGVDRGTPVRIAPSPIIE